MSMDLGGTQGKALWDAGRILYDESVKDVVNGWIGSDDIQVTTRRHRHGTTPRDDYRGIPRVKECGRLMTNRYLSFVGIDYATGGELQAMSMPDEVFGSSDIVGVVYDDAKLVVFSCFGSALDMPDETRFVCVAFRRGDHDVAYRLMCDIYGDNILSDRNDTRFIVGVDSDIKHEAWIDFTNFVSDRAKVFYARNRIDYKRGYLLYGKPGNGKSSFIRKVASHPACFGFANINLGSMSNGDYDLEYTFKSVRNIAKSLSSGVVVVAMEDIDRYFSKKTYQSSEYGGSTKVTFNFLLNCMDGIDSMGNVVIIATANNPSDLDPALVQRPGRFDCIAEFKDPNKEERESFFASRPSVQLSASQLSEASGLCSGLSFAQLQEVFVVAAKHSFSDGREMVTIDDIYRGVGVVNGSVSQFRGFRPAKNAGSKVGL